MIKLSNSKLILILTKLLILLVVAKGISLAIWWYLPSDGVELNVKQNYQPKYQRVNFKNMLTEAKVKKTLKKKEILGNGISITNMILKGLYGKADNGFVIVAMKSNPKKTSIIEIGESYQGYELKLIFSQSAKFHKDGSDFILRLDAIKKELVSSSNEGEVSRKDIEYYAKNPKQIWRDISIVEIKDGKKIKGFKVTKIDPNSKFVNLGLQKDDLIVKANNVELQSYADAIQIYKNIDKSDTIQIVVMRDNKQVELVYEIN